MVHFASVNFSLFCILQQTVDVDQSEWEQEIDLKPYMNRSAYCAFGVSSSQWCAARKVFYVKLLLFPLSPPSWLGFPLSLAVFPVQKCWYEASSYCQQAESGLTLWHIYHTWLLAKLLPKLFTNSVESLDLQ